MQKSGQKAMMLNQNERKNTMILIYIIYTLMKPTKKALTSMGNIETKAYYAGFVA